MRNLTSVPQHSLTQADVCPCIIESSIQFRKRHQGTLPETPLQVVDASSDPVSHSAASLWILWSYLSPMGSNSPPKRVFFKTCQSFRIRAERVCLLSFLRGCVDYVSEFLDEGSAQILDVLPEMFLVRVLGQTFQFLPYVRYRYEVLRTYWTFGEVREKYEAARSIRPAFSSFRSSRAHVRRATTFSLAVCSNMLNRRVSSPSSLSVGETNPMLELNTSDRGRSSSSSTLRTCPCKSLSL